MDPLSLHVCLSITPWKNCKMKSCAGQTKSVFIYLNLFVYFLACLFFAHLFAIKAKGYVSKCVCVPCYRKTEMWGLPSHFGWHLRGLSSLPFCRRFPDIQGLVWVGHYGSQTEGIGRCRFGTLHQWESVWACAGCMRPVATNQQNMN